MKSDSLYAASRQKQTAMPVGSVSTETEYEKYLREKPGRFGGLGGFVVRGYRLNLTHSMPLGLYRITGGPVQRERLASFCLENAEYITLSRERGA